MPFDNDGTITWDLLAERNNSDLANVLGNLVKRTVSMTNQYFGGTAKNTNVKEGVDEELASLTAALREKVAAKMDEFKIADAIDCIWQVLRRANKYIDETMPWALSKDEAKKERLSTVLYNLLSAIDVCANLLYPFMPTTASDILTEIGSQQRDYKDLTTFVYSKAYTVTPNPKTLFERIKMQDIQPKIDAIVNKQKAENAPAVATEEQEVAPITIDDFAKVRMQVGLVVACEAVKKSKLLHETVKVGDKTLSILSGIGKHYTAEEMVGKKVIVVTNLPPREMKGIVSEGMIVCAEAPDGTLSLISPEKDVPDGSLLS
jgi:methionyl-tRNA synthetase